MKNSENPGKPAKAETATQTAEGVKAKTIKTTVETPLNSDEKVQLEKLEKVIDAKLGDFFEVGSAILEIKRKKLYRDTHPNFNVYCQERWGFGKSYADKLLGSAERIKLLPENTTRPANEFQIRPFLKLEPEAFPNKWKEILVAAGERKITSKIVEDALDLPKKKTKKRSAKTSARKKEIHDVLESLRASLKEKNMEEALKHLSKLESLLKA